MEEGLTAELYGFYFRVGDPHPTVCFEWHPGHREGDWLCRYDGAEGRGSTQLWALRNMIRVHRPRLSDRG